MNDDINHIPSNTPDFQTELAEKLAELAPEAIADGKIDVEKLKELLNGDADESNERFGLFWPGKRRALRAAQQPTTATLKPDVENDKDWDTTYNVFSEGDNLEVLKVMQKHYHGKIKMIYIDPPYNTGKDFVYPDNFKEGLDTYLEWTKQVNEEGQKLSTNSESEGRFHSNWLNMIYPRLKLARNLLTEDGALLISIDDHEQENLRKVCSEIFGETNVEMMIWNKEASGASGTLKAVRTFRRTHEYILVCHRNLAYSQWNKVREALEGREDELQTANLAVNAEQQGTAHEHFYPITNRTEDTFTRQWKWGKEEIERLIEEDLIYWGSDGRKQPRLVIPTDHRRTTFLRSILNYGGTTVGRKDFEQVMGEDIEFSFPKPVLLLKKLILSLTTGDDIVLDFFAGSGTTAVATMEANSEDGAQRRHIRVQLPEQTASTSVAFHSGLESIAAIARSRIELAGVRHKTELREPTIDVGFRTFVLSDTNYSKWQVSSDTPANELEQHLLDLRESANDNASPDALLTELLLKQGFSLTERIGDTSIGGLDLKTVLDAEGEVSVLAYLDVRRKPTLDQLREIADSKPVRFVILEDCFQGDDELKTNLVQICKTSGVELWTA